MAKWIVLLSSLIVIAACATSRPAPTPGPATAGQPQETVARGTPPEGQNLVCTVDYPTGSHVPQRICITQAEAAARQKASQQTMQNLQMQGAQMQGTGGGPP